MCAKQTRSGKHVASLVEDNLLRLHDPASGVVMKSVNSKIAGKMAIGRGTLAVQYCEQDNFGDGENGWFYGVLLVNDETLEPITKLMGHLAEVWDIALSTDMSTVVSGSGDKTVCIWARNGEGEFVCEKVLRDNGVVYAVDISPNDELLAFGGSDTNIWVYTLADVTALLYATLEGHIQDVNSISFSPDSTILCSGSSDKSLRLWRVVDRVQIISLDNAHGECINAVVYSPLGGLIASCSDDSTIKVWSKLLELKHVIEFSDIIHNWTLSVSFSTCGTHLLSTHGKYPGNRHTIISTPTPSFKTYNTVVIPTILLLKQNFIPWGDNRVTLYENKQEVPTFESALELCGYLITHELQGILVEVFAYAFGVKILYQPKKPGKQS